MYVFCGEKLCFCKLKENETLIRQCVGLNFNMTK